METAWRYIMKGFSVISRLWRSAPYYLTFVRSQRLYHMKLYLLLFPILHVFLFLNHVFHPLHIIHVLRVMPSPNTEESGHFMSCSMKWPASSIFSHTQCGPQCARFTGYDQGAQEGALATGVYLPVCSWSHPLEPDWHLYLLSLWFQPQNSTINWVPMRRKTSSTMCWCKP